MENEDIEIETFEKFNQALCSFLDEWRNNENLPSILLQTGLLYEAKIEACFNEKCVYQMLGKMNYILNDGFIEMFEEIQKIIKEDQIEH